VSEEKEQSLGVTGRYEIQGVMHRGGFGTIYKVWDKQLQRQAALKRLDQENADEVTKVDDLWWEAISLASLQHPNILSVYDFGTDEQGPYIVMEFIDGENLGTFVNNFKYDLNSFTDAAIQTLRGLIAAHEKDLIHRDIKPFNIMVTRLPSDYLLYKILDFGLVDILEQQINNPFVKRNKIYGSLHYIAPEQLQQKPPDFRTDLYAIGCVYYFMLTKQHAFGGKSTEEIMKSHLLHEFELLDSLRPDLPAAVTDWVMKLMNRDPEDRPASAKEALANLVQILDSL